MIKQGRGVIVNFSLGWGRFVDVDVVLYCVIKWVIEGFMLVLAWELFFGMVVVLFNSGIINIAMLQSCFGEFVGGYLGLEDWVKCVVSFLLKLTKHDNN